MNRCYSKELDLQLVSDCSDIIETFGLFYK